MSDSEPLTVKALIEFLKTQPQNITVVYRCCSEYTALTADEIFVSKLQPMRPDGWVHNRWGDAKLGTVEYLTLPGN